MAGAGPSRPSVSPSTLVHCSSGLLIAPARAADATVSAAVNIPMKVAVIISQVLSKCGLGTPSVRIPAYPLFRLRTVNSHAGSRNSSFPRRSQARSAFVEYRGSATCVSTLLHTVNLRQATQGHCQDRARAQPFDRSHQRLCLSRRDRWADNSRRWLHTRSARLRLGDGESAASFGLG